MLSKQKMESYDTRLVTERFFLWAYRRRLWPQLIALAVTGTASYLLYPVYWETNRISIAFAAIINLVAAFGFAMLIIRSIVYTMPIPSPRVVALCLLFAGTWTIYSLHYPVRMDNMYFWMGLLATATAIVIAVYGRESTIESKAE